MWAQISARNSKGVELPEVMLRAGRADLLGRRGGQASRAHPERLGHAEALSGADAASRNEGRGDRESASPRYACALSRTASGVAQPLLDDLIHVARDAPNATAIPKCDLDLTLG